MLMYTQCIRRHMEQGIKFNTKKNSTGIKVMTAKFDGRCMMEKAAVEPCGRRILAGQQIAYCPYERVAMHLECCPSIQVA